MHTGAAAKCCHWLVVARGRVAEKGGNEELRFGAGRKDFMTLPLWLLLLVACARSCAHAGGGKVLLLRGCVALVVFTGSCQQVPLKIWKFSIWDIHNVRHWPIVSILECASNGGLSCLPKLSHPRRRNRFM